MARKSSTERPTTTRSDEGFYEPFAIDDVPWPKLPGSMTIGNNRSDDIVIFPKTSKVRIRATGKTVPLSEVQ